MKTSRRRSRRTQLELFPHDESPDLDSRPEMICFRGQTLFMVRHFFEISSQLGRLPSLMGREFFRAKCSHHAIPSFEEQAVFNRDIELCLARLTDQQAEIITLVGLYDFSREDAAAMLGCSRAWASERLATALDRLAEIFLHAGLLSEDRPDRRQRQVVARALPADVATAARRRPCASVAVEPDSTLSVAGDCKEEVAQR
jgi:DNA-directed RNA polymerase specialized sigma24 family protein